MSHPTLVERPGKYLTFWLASYIISLNRYICLGQNTKNMRNGCPSDFNPAAAPPYCTKDGWAVEVGWGPGNFGP